MYEPKFTIGQKIIIERYNPWIGEYKLSGTIIGYGNVFINGRPTYTIETFDKKVWKEIEEKEILSSTQEYRNQS